MGREAELGLVLSRRATARVFTLTGPGGVGKSCLAAAVADAAEESFPDGVWLVDVAELDRGKSVVEATAEALGVRTARRRPIRDQLIHWCAERNLLLTLDNIDPRLTECAHMVADLMRDCPGVQALCTGREALDLRGEIIWPVSPLAVPRLSATSLSEIQASPAVQFLTCCIQIVQPDFSVTRENATSMAHICRRMGGLPLALEIVASHVPQRSLSTMAARVDPSFALDLPGAEDGPPRHRSLRANLDWSRALLTQRERLFLARLSTFVGGWTLDAAEAVCAGRPIPRDRVAGLLERLVRQSLVVTDHRGDPTRYRFAPFVRSYAGAMLRQTAAHEQLEGRHSTYVLGMASQVAPESLDVEHAARLDRDTGNLYAVLRRAVARRDVDLAFNVGLASASLWFRAARLTEGHAWLTRCCALPATTTQQVRLRAMLGCIAGHLALLTGQAHAARRLLGEARDVHTRHDYDTGIVWATHLLALLELWSGNLQAARVLVDETSDRLQRMPRDTDVMRLLQPAVLVASARVATELGDYRHAERLAADAMTFARTRQSPFWMARALHAQAMLADRLGQASIAVWLAERATGLQRAERDTVGLVDSLSGLGELKLAAGNQSEGLSILANAAYTANKIGHRLAVVWALEATARAADARYPEAATRLSSAAEAFRARLGFTSSTNAQLWSTAVAFGPAEAVHMITDLKRTQVRPPQQTEIVLTQREREVAALLAQGLSNRQIAARLAISEGTVRSHVDHLLAKLGVHSRAHVAAWALQQATA